MPPWNWLPEVLEATVASEVNEQGRDDTPAEGRGDAILTHDQRGILVNFDTFPVSSWVSLIWALICSLNL